MRLGAGDNVLVCGGGVLGSAREPVGQAGAASPLQDACQLTSAPESGGDGDGAAEGAVPPSWRLGRIGNRRGEILRFCLLFPGLPLTSSR